MKFDKTLKIAPAILSADFANFGAECRAIEKEGADLVHIDVMDGHFVPNITFGVETCKSIRPHIKTFMDVHLMISPVDSFIEGFAEAGADIISAHVEATPHILRTMQTIRSLKVKAGVALNPVKTGARIRGRFRMNSVKRKSELQILRELGLTIEIENEPTPALYAEWLGLAIFG